ncbi:MAG: hypothetical protein KMY53_03895, partial [Desulfarculus sp.]|nr:hypothetical protein [Desulfarculus sp.]
MAPNKALPEPAYLYSDDFQHFDYGPQHPMRMRRLALTNELMELCGLTATPSPFAPASFEELMIYHDRRYLETLQELSASPLASGYVAFGLGPADNPIFQGMYELSALIAGGTLAAARLVSREGLPAAVNISGGMHHALAARAARLRDINDPVLALRRREQPRNRVAYEGIPAPHGDGGQGSIFES